jgi:hypothetical protein
MNPYLEQDDVWEDFHGRLIPVIAERLERQVGPNYIVKIEPRLYIRELGAEERRFLGRSDVGLAALPRRQVNEGSTALAEAPVELWLPEVDVFHEHHVEIRDRRDRRVVTAIEVLSPTNKASGPNRDSYLAKRRELLGSTTHLVEIDLRRGGQRPPLDDLPPCDYYVLVSRYRDRPRIGVWPIHLPEALPNISVPLADPDESARLDLQAALHQVYDAANYGKYIYESQPQPPLSPELAAWAAGIVA